MAELKVGTVVGYVRKPMERLDAAFAALMPQPEPALELHALDRWNIGRTKWQWQNARVARTSLEREGFEPYSPEWCETLTPPLAKLPSKTRHRARLMVRHVWRPLLPGLIFFRRQWGQFDPYRVYELDGMRGACCFGSHLATVADYEIELLRLRVANLEFDRERMGSSRLRYDRPAFGDPRELGKTAARVLKEIDVDGRLVQFIDQLGRITRVITSSSVAVREVGA